MNRALPILGVAGLALLTVSAPAVAGTDDGAKKVLVCHATGSAGNPYVATFISINALSNHKLETADIVPPNSVLQQGHNWTAGMANYAKFCAPPVAEQSATQEQPPAEQPPAEQPPAEQPPAEQPPAEQPPVEEQPPAEQPPAEQPPTQEQPPAEQPPAEQPPVEEQPPAEQPPAEQPPLAEQPPVEEQPLAEPPPAEQPPVVEQPPAEHPSTQKQPTVVPETPVTLVPVVETPAGEAAAVTQLAVTQVPVAEVSRGTNQGYNAQTSAGGTGGSTTWLAGLGVLLGAGALVSARRKSRAESPTAG